jgi:hypothetical protein
MVNTQKRSEVSESRIRIVRQSRRQRPAARHLDVVGQIREAFSRGPLATAFGALLGGGVPVGVYRMAHFELATLPTWWDLRALKAIIVLGGLLFSATTVWKWGRLAFRSPVKATGFVLILEGVMTFSSDAVLSLGALGYLVVINAVATACTIALADRGAAR